MQYYDLIPSLKDVNLEDSWVLGCEEYDNLIAFSIEAVLSKLHPLYREPPPTEARCTMNSRLSFVGIFAKKWIRKNFKPVIGPQGEIDYENIDSFIKENDEWRIEGPWGCLEVKCKDVVFEIIPGTAYTMP